MAVLSQKLGSLRELQVVMANQPFLQQEGCMHCWIHEGI
jgi:hypothetical protein